MHTKKKYSILEMAMWTRFETLLFLVIITIYVSGCFFLDLQWLQIPWTPLALIGTAVAFVIGFQNNSSYGRIWEARKIWGGIVNTSRTFGMFLQDMITSEYCKTTVGEEEIKYEIKILAYRHIVWMTALRYAMRTTKPWETILKQRTDREWGLLPPEMENKLENDLQPYISTNDFDSISQKTNKQTALLYLQSHHLRTWKEKGLIWEFSFLELEGVLQELFTLQGQSERIKNFPYPRHFATLNHYFMWVFILILPLALVPQFGEIGNEIAISNPVIGKFFVWVTIPFYVIVAWIFHTMERIGRTGETPFEGSANDVPISTIARGIEIDLRQNLGEPVDSIPKQFPEKHHTQF